jgi:antitoxin Phd
MSRTWQLQEAKNKLSELVENALQDGPQRITRRGKTAAVVVSAREYDRLKRGKEDLVAFLRRSPLRGVPLDRARDIPRRIEL